MKKQNVILYFTSIAICTILFCTIFMRFKAVEKTDLNLEQSTHIAREPDSPPVFENLTRIVIGDTSVFDLPRVVGEIDPIPTESSSERCAIVNLKVAPI